MQSKTVFPKFWRRQHDNIDAPDQPAQVEAPVNKVTARTAEGLTGTQGDLLSYDDIYHAAGIVSPASGYGIHKVVEMLDSDHIRSLSKEIKRASVLMALDAADTSVEDLLKDATRRQQGLNAYEAGQQSKLDEFESRKAQEDVRIQAEMDRVIAHYAERIQHNRDQVAHEREAMRNWQMGKQQESQRISEVMELCAKQPASAPATDAQAAPSRPSTTVAQAVNVPAHPGVAAKASGGH